MIRIQLSLADIGMIRIQLFLVVDLGKIRIQLSLADFGVIRIRLSLADLGMIRIQLFLADLEKIRIQLSLADLGMIRIQLSLADLKCPGRPVQSDLPSQIVWRCRRMHGICGDLFLYRQTVDAVESRRYVFSPPNTLRKPGGIILAYLQSP